MAWHNIGLKKKLKKHNRRFFEGIVFMIVGIVVAVFAIISIVNGISGYRKVNFTGRHDVTGTIMSRVATMYSEGTRYNCLVSYEYKGENYAYTFPYRAADATTLPEVGKKVKFSLRENEPDVLIEYRKFSLLSTILCGVTAVVVVVLCGMLAVRDLAAYKGRGRKHE